MGNGKQSGLFGETRVEYSMETEWSAPWKQNGVLQGNRVD